MENKSSGKSGEVSKNESTAKKQVSNYQPGNTANNSKKAAGQAVDVSNTLNFNFALLIARRYSLYPISSSTLSLETNMKRYFEYLKSENLSDHACLEHYLERFAPDLFGHRGLSPQEVERLAKHDFFELELQLESYTPRQHPFSKHTEGNVRSTSFSKHHENSSHRSDDPLLQSSDQGYGKRKRGYSNTTGNKRGRIDSEVEHNFAATPLGFKCPLGTWKSPRVGNKNDYPHGFDSRDGLPFCRIIFEGSNLFEAIQTSFPKWKEWFPHVVIRTIPYPTVDPTHVIIYCKPLPEWLKKSWHTEYYAGCVHRILNGFSKYRNTAATVRQKLHFSSTLNKFFEANAHLFYPEIGGRYGPLPGITRKFAPMYSFSLAPGQNSNPGKKYLRGIPRGIAYIMPQLQSSPERPTTPAIREELGMQNPSREWYRDSEPSQKQVSHPAEQLLEPHYEPFSKRLEQQDSIPRPVVPSNRPEPMDASGSELKLVCSHHLELSSEIGARSDMILSHAPREMKEMLPLVWAGLTREQIGYKIEQYFGILTKDKAEEQLALFFK